METDEAVDDVAANADAWMAQERLPEELELPDDSVVALTPAAAVVVALTPAEVEAARDAAERELERWRQPAAEEEDAHARQSEADVARGQAMWQRYEALTAQLSIDLAEQLRLVLEPTMASKLQVRVCRE